MVLHKSQVCALSQPALFQKTPHAKGQIAACISKCLSVWEGPSIGFLNLFTAWEVGYRTLITIPAVPNAFKLQTFKQALTLAMGAPPLAEQHSAFLEPRLIFQSQAVEVKTHALLVQLASPLP